MSGIQQLVSFYGAVWCVNSVLTVVLGVLLSCVVMSFHGTICHSPSHFLLSAVIMGMHESDKQT